MADFSNNIGDLFEQTVAHQSPLSDLRKFLDAENRARAARETSKMRFVGYVLDIGYDTARLITSDPYKVAVGGVPRGSFLVMVPSGRKSDEARALPLHFSLLRVTDVATTPLTNQVQQTYFELHKKAMPELDVWTQGELQWGALDCDVLGMFYADPGDNTRLAFSGDVNNVVSAHRYEVFAPDHKLLDLIVNGTVPHVRREQIGALRTMECRLGPTEGRPQIPAMISMNDFAGRRCAMFGKTRLGKSNVVKLVAQGILDATASATGEPEDPKVGQLIFDLNGEYANDNLQDDNRSLRSANPTRCGVYALTKREGTDSKPLRLNFYSQPDACMGVLRSLLEKDARDSIYVKNFTSVSLPDIPTMKDEKDFSRRSRLIRHVMIYWAVLNRAGFRIDDAHLKAADLHQPKRRHFDPGFSKDDRKTVGLGGSTGEEGRPSSLDQMTQELEKFGASLNDGVTFTTSSGSDLFDADAKNLLSFLQPKSGTGPSILSPYREYHDPNATNFVKEITRDLDNGRTIILDLGNATDEIRRYFSDMLSRAIFVHQEGKFVGNKLAGHFVQLYFEEAHNLFPVNDKELTGPYARFAKEGAKFHIGMVYSTQSPSTVNRDLLDQTENFFIGHLSSRDETAALAKRQVAFVGHEGDILRSRTPGYMRMLTQSHRFVVPIQARKYEPSVVKREK